MAAWGQIRTEQVNLCALEEPAAECLEQVKVPFKVVLLNFLSAFLSGGKCTFHIVLPRETGTKENNPPTGLLGSRFSQGTATNPGSLRFCRKLCASWTPNYIFSETAIFSNWFLEIVKVILRCGNRTFFKFVLIVWNLLKQANSNFAGTTVRRADPRFWSGWEAELQNLKSNQW